MTACRLTTTASIPDDGTLAFTIERDGERKEVLLTRLEDDRVAAWENNCQHWIDVRLDKGEGAVVRGDEILCQNHGAMFDRETGRCTWGPCEGARLDPVAVDQTGGEVYLDAPGWRVVAPGVDDVNALGSRGGLDL